MDIIPVKSHIAMVTMRKEDGLQIKRYPFLIWECLMDVVYGPCWRCEGMGV